MENNRPRKTPGEGIRRYLNTLSASGSENIPSDNFRVSAQLSSTVSPQSLGDSTLLFDSSPPANPSDIIEILDSPIRFQSRGANPTNTHQPPSIVQPTGSAALAVDILSEHPRTDNLPATGGRKIKKTMVKEREPPKAPSPSKPNQQLPPRMPQHQGLQPEFGKPSALNSPLRSNVFNIPKKGQPRPEHHTGPVSRHDQQRQYNIQYSASDPFQPVKPTAYTSKSSTDGDDSIVEIPRPSNPKTWTTSAPPQPMFSSHGFGGGPAYSQSYADNYVDLTKTHNNDDVFNPDRALFDGKFGSADPYAYVDSGQANENIKALLEGAFEDEDDEPKTRSRAKRIAEKTDKLADRLGGLKVGEAESPDKEPTDEVEEEEDDGTVEGLAIKLLPHQIEGVSWMRDKESRIKKKNGVLPKGGILADDMGLGKTIQSLSLILTNPRPKFSDPVEAGTRKVSANVDKGTLVVAPLALIRQWEAEIKEKVLPSHKLRVCVHHGPQRTKSSEDLKRYDVVITTYQILVSEFGNSSKDEGGLKAGCFGVHWYRILLDEAHSIKNRNAKASQACCALKAEYRWCLTGTPMQNNLDELQSLIKFLRIKPYNDLATWKDQITRPLNNGRGGVAIKRLQYYLKAFMKRRTKDVLRQEGALSTGTSHASKDKPKTTFQITGRKIEKVVAEFSPKEREFYDHLEQRADRRLQQMMDELDESQKLNYAGALVLLLRLRQACNHPKLVGGNLKNDHDAMSTPDLAIQSPKKSKSASNDDLDDVTNLMGGLSVETKKCDICQVKLSSEEAGMGAIRCAECEGDLANVTPQKASKKSKKHKKHSKRESPGPENTKPSIPKDRNRNKRIVLDSDDEEEDGEWIVPEGQRPAASLGKAGGEEDENIEGGGEWLGSENSETEDDDDEVDSETDDQSDSEADDLDEEADSVLDRSKEVISLADSDEEQEEQDVEEDEEEESEPETESDFEEEMQEAGSISLSSKVRKLMEILRKETSEHKFIVYSEFTSMLNIIEPFLRKEHLVFTRYDGSMRNDLREASLDRLRNDKKTRILLCSLKCGSLGLNLTAASRVVILEPFWNPFIEEQAIDRVHRINQTVDVVVYKITVANTVEERILALQEKKRLLASAAIEGKGGAKLSMKDVLALFRRDAEALHGDFDPDDGLGSKVKVLELSQSSTPSHSTERSQQESRRNPAQLERRAHKTSEPKDSAYSRRW
ncbi:MAG: hypothetical protein M1834_008958 [Cirrosporium novae-zelandiae]|nr:MAG: hypothetical protein M1834_008958 [Cirrosporium novae-zelandiae]